MPIDKNQYVGVVLKTTPSALFMLCAIYFAFYAQIGDVDKMKPDDKKMVFAFLDAFITKTKLQTLL